MNEQDRLAEEIVKKYMVFAGGAGLIPIPVLDFVAISGIQLKMLAELGGVYNVPFSSDRVKPIIGSILGGYTSTRLGFGAGASLLKSIPVIGSVLGVVAVPGFAAGLTWAVGKVFIQHFASGGTFLDFDPEKVRAYYRSAGATA